ncbi:MAG: CAP domain-containing protein [Candidatus Acidiferrales bacterium]
MLELINGDRMAASSQQETKGRARPLQWDARLAAVARAHSEEMARNEYFGHQGLDGSTPAARVSRAGIQWRSTAENIAKTSDVVQAEAHFMNEPKFQHNHRGNILNPNYTHVGVGIVRGPDGALYITQEFAELR